MEPSFHYLSKFPVNGPHPPSSPKGPLRRETTVYRTFCIPSPENSSFLQSPWYGSPHHVPQQGPYGERYSFCRATDLSTHLCLPSSQQGSFLQNREKHKVTIHVALCRQKAYIQWGAAWFSKGIINNTVISTSVPCSPRHDTFHLTLGRPEPCQPACVIATPNRVYPAHLFRPPT